MTNNKKELDGFNRLRIATEWLVSFEYNYYSEYGETLDQYWRESDKSTIKHEYGESISRTILEYMDLHYRYSKNKPVFDLEIEVDAIIKLIAMLLYYYTERMNSFGLSELYPELLPRVKDND